MNNDFRNAEHLGRSNPGNLRQIRKKRSVTLLTVFMLITVAVQTLYIPPLEASAASVVLVGAGDIASCGYNRDEATAKLLDQIPGTVFAAGDLAYTNGSYAQFTKCYHPTWGRHKNRTKPVPGNHEYKTSGAAGYFNYFSDTPSYYAYDLGDWRIYALNSEINASPTSEQVKWLRQDLAANPKLCVLAYWHRPRWSSGNHHGGDQKTQALWNTLYKAGAELVINGHEHHYERFRADGWHRCSCYSRVARDRCWHRRRRTLWFRFHSPNQPGAKCRYVWRIEIDAPHGPLFLEVYPGGVENVYRQRHQHVSLAIDHPTPDKSSGVGWYASITQVFTAILTAKFLLGSNLKQGNHVLVL